MDSGAGEYRVPLTNFRSGSPGGDYIVADFDFGTRFSEIETVSLEFWMPEGYEGGGLVGGTFMTTKNLVALIFGKDDHLDLTADHFSAPSGSEKRQFVTVPADHSVETRMSTPELCGVLEGEYVCGAPRWPIAIESGAGRVAFFDEFLMYSFSGPGAGQALAVREYGLPRDVSEGYVTVVGTLVPEPGALGMLLAVTGALAFGSARRRRDAPGD